jgi:hypothetical protein
VSPPNACNVLRQADSGHLIVATDFAATGRTTATFRELVGMLRTESNFWEVAPVPYGHESGVTGKDQIDRWATDVRQSDLQVHAVIGFCAGSVYAGELAERIAVWQERPRLILLDPARAEIPMLVEHVERWLDRLAKTFSPAHLADARRDVRNANAPDGEPLELAARLVKLYEKLITPALIRAGQSVQASLELTSLITGYLYWLAGAIQLAPRAKWSHATALSSETLGFGLHLIPPPERANLVAKAIYFDVSHTELLRNAEVAHVVDDLLN